MDTGGTMDKVKAASGRLNILTGLCFLSWVGLPIPTSAIANETFIFRQVPSAGYSGKFCVRCNHARGVFNIVQWESNPNTQDGADVPMTWDMSPYTGFAPKGNLSTSQIGFSNNVGASGAQMSENTVGAYIDSTDLINGSPRSKFIITPNYEFQQPAAIFKQNGSFVQVSFEIQIPVAEDRNTAGSSSYVVSDLHFFNAKTGARIYVNAALFKNRSMRFADFTFYDADTRSKVALGSVSPSSRFITPCAGSTLYQSRPWRGWKAFCYKIDQANLAEALSAVNGTRPRILSDLADWELEKWHLNAEILFSSGPARLGWSMRNVTIVRSDGPN